MTDLSGKGNFFRIPGNGSGGKLTIQTTQRFEDGESAAVLSVKGKIAEIWAGWGQLSICLEESDEALKALLDLGDVNEDMPVKKSLWFFAVIQYGKCFKENEGWSGVKLDARISLAVLI